MKTNWNLDVMYKGFSDPQYDADMKKAEAAFGALHEAVLKAPEKAEKKRVEDILKALESIEEITYKIGLYTSLRQSVNTKDGEAMASMARLMRIVSAGAADNAAAKKILGEVADPEALSKESELICTYKVLLEDAKKDRAHLLSDEVESMAAAMDMTGGSAWGDLQSFMTSTVKVDYDGRTATLSEIRNLAYDPDVNVRKAAYEAELKSYEKIQDAIAFALNNIKNQVTMMAGKRGYESPLSMTLENSKMTKETLDAMLGAMVEFMPVFRKYLRKKGEYLGDKNGLKWYNLFAPLGASDKKYTVEETKALLVKVFKEFTPELSDMMARAFDEEWIDFFPADGKEGGAFCAGAAFLKQSRILTNFDGTFGAVDTLAHELGHAYHNLQIENESIMNQGMAMQVAETASTFDEVFLGDYALKNAKSKEERLALLESDLREKTQCVVDIYSRYLFESAVFAGAKEKFLMAPDLCEMMLDAQDKSYGDGLDPDYKHAWMWACKSHYYSSGLSFYNFPYAFGNLFAQGLYALYLKDKEGFIPKYRNMLRTTGVHTVEECGEMMGIDVTKPDFWRESLKLIADEIEEFCEIVG